ncbi:hypothetical protein QVD17_25479 [Tagetes erecta]|uniref:Uncharacterized protein n=1 Tax=Tagetes erecta TaxID=13708 RepID=A0AAD8KGD3_TARER|nr:hypothetical protein QVD17_25479 [Tagetes erecta]
MKVLRSTPRPSLLLRWLSGCNRYRLPIFGSGRPMVCYISFQLDKNQFRLGPGLLPFGFMFYGGFHAPQQSVMESSK